MKQNYQYNSRFASLEPDNTIHARYKIHRYIYKKWLIRKLTYYTAKNTIKFSDICG